MEILLYVLIGVLGLVVGSFLNAYVWRTYTREESKSKQEESGTAPSVGQAQGKQKPSDSKENGSAPDSVLRGRSACPGCGHTLHVRDLVPVVSWLWLRGKCRYCKNDISWQYPVVEIATAGLFILSVWWWPFVLGDSVSWIQLGVWLGITALIIALSTYDLRWYILPDVMLLPLLTFILAWQALAAIGGAPLQQWLIGPVLGGAGAFLFFYLLHVAGRGRWMGGGDVKLVFVLGLLVGGIATVVGLFIGFLSAAAIGMALIVSRHKSRRDMVPFGPFLLLGFWLAFFFGDRIAQWYTGLIAV